MTAAPGDRPRPAGESSTGVMPAGASGLRPLFVVVLVSAAVALSLAL
jgi:hypothetical protein